VARHPPAPVRAALGQGPARAQQGRPGAEFGRQARQCPEGPRTNRGWRQELVFREFAGRAETVASTLGSPGPAPGIGDSAGLAGDQEPVSSRWRCPRPASRRRRVTAEAAQPTPIPDAPLRARNGHVLGRRSPLPVRHGAGPSQRSHLEPRQRDYGRPAPVRRRPASARSVLNPMHRGTPYDPIFPLVWAPVMRTACNGLLPTRRAGSIAPSRTRDGPFFLSRASARRRTAEAAVFGRH
jgi:hypothetical protein